MGLAARGSRHLGEEAEAIDDAAELAQVRRQARQVQFRALLTAIFLTLLAVAVPLPA